MGCIYGFLDKDKRFFYVGQTKDLTKRLYGHVFEIRHENKLYFYNKLRKVMVETGLPIKALVVIIEDNLSLDQLDEREIYHIKALRLEGYKLTNLTDGGRRFEGAFSEEQKNKIRAAHLGKKRSEETRRRMSEAQTGRKFTSEHKKKLSIARQKRVTTDETREKLSLARKGKVNIKKYVLTDPEGIEHVTEEGMTKFCEEHGLSTPLMHKVLTKQRKHHRGWTIREFE